MMNPKDGGKDLLRRECEPDTPGFVMQGSLLCPDKTIQN